MDLQQPLPEVGQSVGVRGRIREDREMRYCPFGVQAVGKREAVGSEFRAGGFSRWRVFTTLWGSILQFLDFDAWWRAHPGVDGAEGRLDRLPALAQLGVKTKSR